MLRPRVFKIVVLQQSRRKEDHHHPLIEKETGKIIKISDGRKQPKREDLFQKIVKKVPSG